MEKKAVSGIMLTLLLTSIVTLAFNIQPVKAEPAEIIIDTEVGESRFTTYPPRQSPYYWVHVQDHGTFRTRAYGGNFWYTLCGAEGTGEPLYYGLWQASLPYGGVYEVFVWIPNPDPFEYDGRVYTPTQSAIYQIYHKDGVAYKTVNQRLRTGGWYSVGTFTFDTTASIILNDRTGEPYLSTMIAFDAIKLVHINHDPYKPYNPSPLNHATLVPITTDLSWSGGDPDAGDTVTYDVYFGTSPSPPLVSNDQSATTYDPGTLSYSTKYYWKIVATDNHGAFTVGDVWDFTTQPAPDFSISAFPTSLSIQQGSSGSSAITITSINGFNQPVQLTVSGAPSGATTTLTPSQVTPPPDGSITSTLTVSVATTATPGSYTLTVTGTSGALTHSTYISLEIPPPEYRTLTVYSSPSGVTFTADGVSHTTPWSQTYTEGTSVGLVMPSTHTVGEARYYWDRWSDGITSRSRTVVMDTDITLTAQYPGPYYQLTVTSSPVTGIPFTIDGASKTTSYTEWLLQGSHTIEMPITYNEYTWSHWQEDGDTNRIKTITLSGTTTWTAVYIPPPEPDFEISASPNSLIIEQGNFDTSTITITSLNGFNQPVQLTLTGEPSGVTTTFNPVQVTPPPDGSTTSTLTVSVDATATLGIYTLTVTGTSGTLTHSTYISLEITVAPPPPNQPPNPPNFLLQYELDGPEIPVGGTICGDAVTLLGAAIDPDEDQVKIQIELRRLDEYAGSFIGVPTHESDFVDSDVVVLINITGLVLGDYHWQARTVDEPGATSDWVSFPEPLYPPNPESEADFTVGQVFRPPYAVGDKYSDKSAYGPWTRTYNYSSVDEITGVGAIVAAATVVSFSGVAYSEASITFIHTWRSTFSGQCRIVGTFNISGNIGVWILYGDAMSSITLDASLTVYDSTEGRNVLTVPKPISELILYSMDNKHKSFPGSTLFLEGLLDIIEGHFYSWIFEIRLKATVATVSLVASGNAWGGIREAKLIQVCLQPPEPWSPPPEGPVYTIENALWVAVGSPVEVLIVNPDGRRVGFDFISKQEVNEIPDAWYSGPNMELQFIYIPRPLIGPYNISLAGTDRGTYALIATSFELGEATTFTTIEIPVATNEIHQYTVDWDALSLGEEGVTVQVDSEGDGVFEHTFTSDSELTQSEFLAGTGQRALFFEIIWGEETFTVSVESNSTVYNFAFNQPDKQVSFNVTGEAGTIGFCNVTIPKALLYGEPWTVLIDGAPVPTTITENATHSFLYFTYAHSTHEIQIIGTWVIGPPPDTNPPLIETPFQEPEPDKVMPDQAVTVYVNVTDMESGVKSVILSYTTNGGATWTNLTMLYNATTALYQATIPAFPSGTNICYKVIAYDNADNVAINDNAGQYYCYTVGTLGRDIAIVDIAISTNATYAGRSVTINVTASNLGNTTETFNVTLYYDNNLINTTQIQNLPPDTNATTTFHWDTTDITPCNNYNITAKATILPGETNTTNNTLKNGTVKIKMLGDIDGDGTVDMTDVYLIVLGFGYYTGHPRWNPNLDLDNNGMIDIRDIWLVVVNFGKCI